MGRAKEIELKVIPQKIASDYIRRHHYSGKVVNNSCLHFGAFLDGKLHGVMQYGPPLDKSKVIGLVAGTGWNEMLELNRMAFDDYLPRNAESRCISQSIKLLKKHAPQIKWVLSFADGCSCGDGTIYRASGFVLTGIKRSTNICRLPDGTKLHKMTLESNVGRRWPQFGNRTYWEITGGRYDFKRFVERVGGEIVPGFQLRYIRFIDKESRRRLTVPEIPFSKIDELGAGMYKGERISVSERHIDEFCTNGNK